MQQYGWISKSLCWGLKARPKAPWEGQGGVLDRGIIKGTEFRVDKFTYYLDCGNNFSRYTHIFIHLHIYVHIYVYLLIYTHGKRYFVYFKYMQFSLLHINYISLKLFYKKISINLVVEFIFLDKVKWIQ